MQCTMLKTQPRLAVRQSRPMGVPALGRVRAVVVRADAAKKVRRSLCLGPQVPAGPIGPTAELKKTSSQQAGGPAASRLHGIA